LGAFVAILEDAFVEQEELSGLIGKLASYNIRRMLLLAQKTITSPTFQVDDLIRNFVSARSSEAARGVDSRRPAGIPI
jgi:hypothetical protein